MRRKIEEVSFRVGVVRIPGPDKKAETQREHLIFTVRERKIPNAGMYLRTEYKRSGTANDYFTFQIHSRIEVTACQGNTGLQIVDIRQHFLCYR